MYLGVTDYWEKTPKEVYLEAKAKSRAKEEQLKTSWEQTRVLICSIWKLFDDSVKPSDVLTFTWDEKDGTVKPTEISDIEMRKIFDRWDRNMEQRGMRVIRGGKHGKDGRESVNQIGVE